MKVLLAFLAFCVLIIPLCASLVADDENDPVLEKNWLKEKLWPNLLQDKPMAIQHNEEPLSRLLKERFNSARFEFRTRYIYWLQGTGTLDHVYDAARRTAAARQEITTPPADRFALLRDRVEFGKVAERQAGILFKKLNSAVHALDKAFAEYARLDAEVEWAKAVREANRANQK